MQRPPYLRWAAAGFLVLGAFLWDLRGTSTAPHPFLTAPVPAGEPIPSESIEWQEVPAGLLPVADWETGVAAADLNPGDPILPSSLSTAPPIPDDWWLVPVDVGAHARPGDAVLLVVIEPLTTIPGTVIVSQSGDVYATDFRPASVAVPGEAAPLVAAASRQGMLVTAVRP